MSFSKDFIRALRECFSDSQFEGVFFKKLQTIIYQQHYGVCHTPGYDRTIEIIHDDRVIAMFEPNICRLSIYHIDTIAVRRRINALLREFAPDWSVEMRNGAPVLVDAFYQVPKPFSPGFYTSFNVWHPKRASRWDEPQPIGAAC